MLVELTDNKGVVHWINPVHVKMLKSKKPEMTELFLGAVTWGASPSMKVPRPLREVADLLNSGMPDLLTAYPPPDDDGGGDSSGATAAMAG